LLSLTTYKGGKSIVQLTKFQLFWFNRWASRVPVLKVGAGLTCFSAYSAFEAKRVPKHPVIVHNPGSNRDAAAKSDRNEFQSEMIPIGPSTDQANDFGFPDDYSTLGIIALASA
jgi:hypothetical protein